ncbi:flavocytochrome c [Marinilactibacillus kalidii]|uniref:flavocytochrome c n=1 Tax=Marinilactibacillus kalidii TaxID=2820274 RepID=UPI001ABE758A|nr:flavocytochrome c [Marinilactibacillus kalidii]
MKLIAINGSNAKHSYNRKLLQFIQKRFSEKFELEILETKDIPLFDESNDLSNSTILQAFNDKILMSDGVIIACPEHNHSLSASLKSCLEWLSYNLHPLDGKPTLVVGASAHDQGTSRAQLHLKQVLDAPGVNANVIPGYEFLLDNCEKAFDENGAIKNEGTIDFLETVVGRFIRFAKISNQLLEEEKVTFVPGTYEVTTQGYHGTLPMKVTLSNERIEEIDIDSSGETEGIATVVFERIPQQIVEGQTLNVDAISGASLTCNGVLDGVAKVIKKAGSDPEILRKRPKVKLLAEDKEYETDIVIIGSGGAGLTSAATALENGKKVIVLEKFPSLGGNTVRTGGPINSADPEWQKEMPAIAGEKETLEKMASTSESEIAPEYLDDFKALQKQIAEYLKDPSYLFDSILLHRMQTYFGGKRTDLNGNNIYGNYDLVKTMTDNSLSAIRWLSDQVNVEFDWSNVQMPIGALWRRGHKPVRQQGFAYISALSEFIKTRGGEIYTDTKVTELIIENGQVCGVKATGLAGEKITVRAKAVILATGGFGANTKMLQKYNTYWAQIPDTIKTTNSPAITGDGVELGRQAKTKLVGMGFSQMMPVAHPKTGSLFSGLIVPPENFLMVNPNGKRFVNEYASRDTIAQAALEEGGLFYLIADEPIRHTAHNTSDEQIENEVKDGTLYRADTLEDLAIQIGIEPSILIETVNKYNAYVEAKHDPDFGKDVFNLKITTAPFYATPRQPAVHHTMGGIAIDHQTHALDENDNIIKGLYAVGEVAGGIHAGNRLGGNALTDIFTYGRIAGKIAVSELE